jgi:hypothetical protein
MALFGRAKQVDGPVRLVANDGTPIGDDQQPTPGQQPPTETPAPEALPAGAEGGGQQAPKKEEKPKTMAKTPKNKTTSRKAPARRGKQPSNEAILSRARRMAKKELRKVAEALGLDEYDDEAVQQVLEEMRAAREENMTVLERTEGRAKNLEEQNAELRSKVSQLQHDLTKSQRELEEASQDLADFQVEAEIEKAAAAVGFRDTEYGIELFRRWAAAQPDESELDINSYFEGLKKDPNKRYLFTEEEVTAGPRPAGDTTQPPQLHASQQGQQQSQQQQPGQQGQSQGHNNLPDQGAPPPANPGGQPDAPTDALSMNPKEFSDHASRKYGFRPGMA